MSCRKLTYEQLAAQVAQSHQLEPICHRLVEAGLISPAEWEIAKILKQCYYSPGRRRFANIQPHSANTADVVWLEPATLPRPTCDGRRKS